MLRVRWTESEFAEHPDQRHRVREAVEQRRLDNQIAVIVRRCSTSTRKGPRCGELVGTKRDRETERQRGGQRGKQAGPIIDGSDRYWYSPRRAFIYCSHPFGMSTGSPHNGCSVPGSGMNFVLSSQRRVPTYSPADTSSLIRACSGFWVSDSGRSRCALPLPGAGAVAAAAPAERCANS